jgi:hypothetical protein
MGKITFETWSYDEAQADLKLTILLSQSLASWDCRPMLSHLVVNGNSQKEMPYDYHIISKNCYIFY